MSTVVLPQVVTQSKVNILENKIAGGTTPEPKKKQKTPQVADIMTAMKASLEQIKNKKKQVKP